MIRHYLCNTLSQLYCCASVQVYPLDTVKARLMNGQGASIGAAVRGVLASGVSVPLGAGAWSHMRQLLVHLMCPVTRCYSVEAR